MSASLRKFLEDEDGGPLVEFALVLPAFLLLLFGGLDMSRMFWERNAAAKAMQFGARLAAVSSPVAEELVAFSGVDEDAGVLPGDPLPDNAFDTTCTANSTAASVSCTGGFTGNSEAFRRILYGDPALTTCNPTPTAETVGMCHHFDRLAGNNIVIRYEYTGLGYAGRPAGAVPTITVSLQNMQYDFFALGDLMGLINVPMPTLATTVTGEDLNLAWTAS